MFLARSLVVFFSLFASLILVQGCSSGTSTGSTGSDDSDDTSGETTTLDSDVLAGRVESTASALLPNVSSGGGANITPFSVKAVTYGADSDWDTYTSGDNVAYLEEIFGNDESGPVTQVRILISQFSDTLEQMFSADPDLDCSGSSELTSLSDTITIAFFGSISNGTSDNRFFDCVADFDGGTIIYGTDNDNVLRLVYMGDDTSANSQETETRGDEGRVVQSVYTTYAETSEDDVDVAYIDLQYAQASIYNGPDDSFDDTDDNNIFKSRSRITGRITLDGDGNPDEATGDFYVTKYDRGLNDSEEPYTITTMTAGRGSYASGENFLFSIDSDVDAFDSIPGTFCLNLPEGETAPESDTTTDCTALESDFAWGSATFPFDLEPSVSQDFDDVAFFEEEDLIENDGSDFTIPTYE